jgi:tetratricopeptide (TPR) repeat protein
MDGASLLPLVGRGRELAAMEQTLAGESASLLLFAGEPGIGKSRLLAEAARRGVEGGWTVLVGGCHRRSGQEPFAPFLGLLERHLAQQSSGERTASLQGCAWLVRLLPELAETLAPPALAWALPPEQERRLMFAAVARYLANVAGQAGTLLILDDLQWAGADALDLLTSLLHASPARPLRIVGAYRDTEVRTRDPLADTLADLAREDLVVRVALHPLAAADAITLLNDLFSGTAVGEATLRQQVLQHAGGIPFFLVSYAQGLLSGALADGGDEVPWSVAETIRQRVAALPDVARDLLSIAAIVGRVARRSVLVQAGTASGQSEQQVLAALEAARQSRLLIEEGEATHAFAHDLVREVVGADLSSARRALIHRIVAEALQQEPGEPPIEALAYHYIQAGDPEKACAYLERAATRAQAMYANAEAVVAYRSLVAQLEKAGRVAAAASVCERMGEVLLIMAHYDDALGLVERTIQTYRGLGDTDGVVRATSLLARTHVQRGSALEGRARLESLRESLGADASPHGLATFYMALAEVSDLTSAHREELTAAERAVEYARAAGDDVLFARAEVRRGVALGVLGRTDEGLIVVEAAIPIVESAGDLWSAGYAYSNAVSAYLAQGRIALALRNIERGVELANRIGDTGAIVWTRFWRGVIYFFQGEWTLAQEDFEVGLALAEREGALHVSAYPLGGLGRLCLARGQREVAFAYLGRAIPLAEEARANRVLWPVQRALAERELLLGQPDAAVARLIPIVERPEGAESLDMTPVLPVLAWAYLDLGDRERAAHWLERGTAQVEQQHHRLAQTDVLRIRALAAWRHGQQHEARRMLDDALALCRSLPYPHAEAKALYLYGLLLHEQNQPRQARERFTAALALCNHLGERPYAERIAGALEELPDN